MRTLNKLIATGFMAFLLMLMAPHKSMAQEGYVSDQEFYDNLSQYGTWVQDDQYGDVWVPDVDDDFRPYATNGYWVQTDYGTTWLSDYPWGWATFHYGRWRYDDYYGWEWIPGHEWAPAWVSWRQGGGYYGWAPMGPGISISISLGGGGGYTDDHYWVYAPQRYITSRYISRYYAPPTRVNVIVRNTTIIRNTYVYNNRTYITGPRPAEIQRVTRRPVNVYKINDAPRPGEVRVGVNTKTINIYRPQIRKAPDARPTRVVSATAYKNEHPNEGIARRGGIGYNRSNAVKLATVARTQNPDNRVVKVNPRPNTPPANNPAIPAGGHRNNEPKTNPAGQPNAPQQGGDRRNHANEPANQPQQSTAQKPQAGGNEPARPGQGRGQHRTVPTISQPQQQQQNQQPVQQPNNPAGQPNQAERRQRGHNPAVNPPAKNNADQAQRQQQQEAEQQRQQQAQEQRQQQQQAQQQQREQAQQQQREQQQQVQQAARQQRQQEQQAQRQQQQQAQQQARQQAQQQRQQQQQAARQQQQAARQQQQAQQQQARQQAQQQRQQQQAQREQQQRQQQEEQQKQKQNPPRI